jgi:hypothetical protein
MTPSLRPDHRAGTPARPHSIDGVTTASDPGHVGPPEPASRSGGYVPSPADRANLHLTLACRSLRAFRPRGMSRGRIRELQLAKRIAHLLVRRVVHVGTVRRSLHAVGCPAESASPGRSCPDSLYEGGGRFLTRRRQLRGRRSSVGAQRLDGESAVTDPHLAGGPVVRSVGWRMRCAPSC